jgi:hypothetical protein
LRSESGADKVEDVSEGNPFGGIGGGKEVFAGGGGAKEEAAGGGAGPLLEETDDAGGTELRGADAKPVGVVEVANVRIVVGVQPDGG